MAEKKKVAEKKEKKTKKIAKKVVLVTTEAKHLRISPRKLRLVVDAVKGFSPLVAVSRLKVWNKKGARILGKAIGTVIADAENNFGLKGEGLKFKKILVNEGARLKRMDKSHSARFASGLKQKRLAHLRIVVEGEK